MRRDRRRHSASCGHCPRVRLLGLDYQAWRASWEAREEHAANGYATETAEFRREHPAPTFRDYLLAMRGAAYPMSGRRC